MVIVIHYNYIRSYVHTGLLDYYSQIALQECRVKFQSLLVCTANILVLRGFQHSIVYHAAELVEPFLALKALYEYTFMYICSVIPLP